MKIGLGQSYEKVEYLPKKTRAYIDLTKPASSLGVAGGYFLASMFYFVYVGGGGNVLDIGSKLSSMIYVSLTMFLAHSASQAMNMAEDAYMDEVTPHKKNRPIPSGEVEEEEARSLSWVLVFISFMFAYLLNWRFGVMATILIFMGIFYNLEPVRVKERIISIPWQAVSRGLLMFPSVWAAFGNPFSPEPWILGVFMFFYVLGFQNSADIIDANADANFGIKTWVVSFGIERTLTIALGCVGLMLSTISIGVVLGILPMRFYYLYLISPLCFWMIYKMWRNPSEVSPTTGNHPAWLWFYFGMVLTVAIPLTVEILYFSL